jgi:hypothetical protein
MAKQLLDTVISENKDEKAVKKNLYTKLIKVECYCRTCRRTISRSSAANGIHHEKSSTNSD